MLYDSGANACVRPKDASDNLSADMSVVPVSNHVEGQFDAELTPYEEVLEEGASTVICGGERPIKEAGYVHFRDSDECLLAGGLTDEDKREIAQDIRSS